MVFRDGLHECDYERPNICFVFVYMSVVMNGGI
jgi:hypothetical protein